MYRTAKQTALKKTAERGRTSLFVCPMYLFMTYLTTLSNTDVAQRRMVEWLTNNEPGRSFNEAIVATIFYSSVWGNPREPQNNLEI